MRVKMPSYSYELGPSRNEPTVKMTGQWIGPGWYLGPGRRQRTALWQGQRTRHGEFSFSVGWCGTPRAYLGQSSPAMMTERNAILVVFGSRCVTSGISTLSCNTP